MSDVPAHWATTPAATAHGEKCSCCHKERLIGVPSAPGALVCRRCDNLRGWPNVRNAAP